MSTRPPTPLVLGWEKREGEERGEQESIAAFFVLREKNEVGGK